MSHLHPITMPRAPVSHLTMPERFRVENEPVGRDGHVHEYGARSLRCANPAAPTCKVEMRLTVIRMDKRRAAIARVERIFMARQILTDHSMPPGEMPDRWWP